MPGAVFWTEEAPGEHWLLGPFSLETPYFALLGWSAADETGGVPRKVVTVLSEGLTAFGRVTFPSGQCQAEGPTWTTSGPGRHVARYRSPSRVDRIAGSWLGRGPSELPLMSTMDAEIAASMFDDAAFPWWAQSQAILLSPTQAPPPNLADRWSAMVRLFTPAWAEALPELRSAGVQALARPGVDGDVVGFACATPDIREDVRRCLFQTSEAIGLSAQEVGLQTFTDGVSGNPRT
jgi:hypothetical protein